MDRRGDFQLVTIDSDNEDQINANMVAPNQHPSTLMSEQTMLT